MARRTNRRYNPDSNFDDYDGMDYDYDGSPMIFSDPSGNSALRAAGPGNPRRYSCPTCHTRNVLTRKDKELGYQCDSCADRMERGGY